MLRDAFRRGGLQARMQGAIAGGRPERVSVALGGPRSVFRALAAAGRSPPGERGALWRAMPAVVAGSIAYSMGALVAPESAGTG
jgi:hypothetical protein